MKESSFQFLGYKVTKINYSIDESFGKKLDKLSREVNVKKVIDKKNNRFVEIVLNIKITSKSKKFKLIFQIKGGFLAQRSMPDEIFKKLCDQNAPAILFPYARAIISNITVQANIFPIILPTINFIAPEKKKKAVVKKKK